MRAHSPRRSWHCLNKSCVGTDLCVYLTHIWPEHFEWPLVIGIFVAVADGIALYTIVDNDK